MSESLLDFELAKGGFSWFCDVLASSRRVTHTEIGVSVCCGFYWRTEARRVLRRRLPRALHPHWSPAPRPDHADSLGRRDSQKFRKLGISLEIINGFILSYRLLVSNFFPLLNSSEFSFPFTEAVRTTCWPLSLWRSKSKKFSFLAAQTSPSLRRGPRPSRTSTASR